MAQGPTAPGAAPAAAGPGLERDLAADLLGHDHGLAAHHPVGFLAHPQRPGPEAAEPHAAHGPAERLLDPQVPGEPHEGRARD